MLTQDQPQFNLRAGAVGVVRGATPLPHVAYEIEVLPENAERPVRLAVPAEVLALAPPSPFDPDPLTGRELYF
jgi:hypothetical protein